jgi:hypothetical protein
MVVMIALLTYGLAFLVLAVTAGPETGGASVDAAPARPAEPLRKAA